MRDFARLTATMLLTALVATVMAQPPQPSRPVHTYSIVARDPATGELGVAVQSHWFAVGPVVPWAGPGVGAEATQSFADPRYGRQGLDVMRSGKSAQRRGAVVNFVRVQSWPAPKRVGPQCGHAAAPDRCELVGECPNDLAVMATLLQVQRPGAQGIERSMHAGGKPGGIEYPASAMGEQYGQVVSGR